jgi:hypothetical protein
LEKNPVFLEKNSVWIPILSVRLPVDADPQAFFVDTNQPFLHDWIKNCCLHIPIFGMPTP